jgi:hypothetical protein
VSEKKGAPRFTKQQFLKAANFTQAQRDLLRMILKDDQTYTIDEVKKLIEDFSKRKVN